MLNEGSKVYEYDAFNSFPVSLRHYLRGAVFLSLRGLLLISCYFVRLIIHAQ